MRHIQRAFFIAAILLSGCVGAPPVSGSQSSDLVETRSDSRPLARLDTSTDWEAAPAGCEGRLATPGLTFRVASAQDGLIAAVDDQGNIVCVDTVEAVQSELDAQGHSDEADALGDRFVLAERVEIATSVTVLNAGEPTPQPNCGPVLQGYHEDPTPQPNIDPRSPH